MINRNKFNFFVEADIPEDIFKAANEAEGEDRYKNMVIEGVASDDSVDADDQILEPQGFDFKTFLLKGLVNLEHFTTRKGDPHYYIGEPIDGYVKDNKFFVKSKLWEKHPLARNLWDTLLIMKASGSNRKPGYSIEGKTILKDKENKNRIKKAKISHIAVTFNPKNKNSWFDIVKGEQDDDFVEPEVDTIGKGDYVYQFEKGDCKYGVTKSFEIEKIDDEEEEEKAVTTESTEGLRKESLDKKIKKQIDPEPIMKSIRENKLSPKKALFLIKSFYNR